MSVPYYLLFRASLKCSMSRCPVLWLIWYNASWLGFDNGFLLLLMLFVWQREKSWQKNKTYLLSDGDPMTCIFKCQSLGLNDNRSTIFFSFIFLFYQWISKKHSNLYSKHNQYYYQSCSWVELWMEQHKIKTGRRRKKGKK